MTDMQHNFDESLLSGYLDGELTQGDAQRVRLHLEGCVECQNVIDELRKLRETTMDTDFQVPEDTQWDERPRSGLSGWFRSIGWLVAVVWAVGMTGWLSYLMATDSENWWEAALWFAFLAGGTLLFLSVLIDRLRVRRTDPYRKVEK